MYDNGRVAGIKHVVDLDTPDHARLARLRENGEDAPFLCLRMADIIERYNELGHDGIILLLFRARENDPMAVLLDG
jgi:hypothetical protein